ncbi:MAG TPA: RHS repeat-associated core domain-containing protein, partial [Terriglobales bacterium]|nr:RHS repeat-associated core domain-containing protein [Terriglobales bacterium]
SSTVSFSYDNANRRTSLTLPNGVSMSYSYDNASELTGISYALGQNSLGNLSYTYDLAGRRTSVGGSLAAVNLPNAISTTAYNANNQLTQWGTATPTYDANGNTLSDGTNTYVWNARNQLASMNLTGESFQYDPFGRRTAKTILGTTTHYLYDGSNPVQELSGTNPTANMLTGGIDEYFTRTDSTGTANFLADALGSTISLTNSTGATLASYTYEPFGNTPASGSSTNTYQYTGRENDGTGVYLYRARYYSQSTGRFLSEDPLDGLGLANSYAYASDDPIDNMDPTGLSDLLYIRNGQTLVLLDGKGNIVGTYPAGNNVDSHDSWGPYQPGSYPNNGYNPHPGLGPNSAFGPNGIFYFPRPGCPYCGVHSGRQNVPDQLHRVGPNHATHGCIRTTDDAMRKILQLTKSGDPLRNLYVR